MTWSVKRFPNKVLVMRAMGADAPPYKKFSRHRHYKEIKALCRAQKVPFSDEHYQQGADTVVVGDLKRRCGYVIYNCATGRFFGVTPLSFDGFPRQYGFNSDSDPFEQADWYQALLNFFYVE